MTIHQGPFRTKFATAPRPAAEPVKPKAPAKPRKKRKAKGKVSR
jgi:hypothetical protein